MAPRTDELSPNLTKTIDITENLKQIPDQIPSITKADFKPEILWKKVFIFGILHLMAFYGVYCCFYSKTQTLVFGKINLK